MYLHVFVCIVTTRLASCIISCLSSLYHCDNNYDNITDNTMINMMCDDECSTLPCPIYSLGIAGIQVDSHLIPSKNKGKIQTQIFIHSRSFQVIPGGIRLNHIGNSRWIPPGMPGFLADSTWNAWIPGGFHLEFGWILAGFQSARIRVNLVGIIPSPGEIWVGSHQENIPTKFLPGAWIPTRFQ